MPFRDAGYSQADYALTIQDVVYGIWKAKEEGLVALEIRRHCLARSARATIVVRHHRWWYTSHCVVPLTVLKWRREGANKCKNPIF